MDAVWDPVFVLDGVCVAPEDPLKEMLTEDVKLLVLLGVPVKDAVAVCVSVPVVLSVGGAEPVPVMEAV